MEVYPIKENNNLIKKDSLTHNLSFTHLTLDLTKPGC